MATEDKLHEMKRHVIQWHKYFKENNDRFHADRRYIFRSNLTTEQRNNLGVIQKPPFEFNVLEAYISRLRGEFSKQEPSFSVHPTPDSMYLDPSLPPLIEGHFQAILQDTKRDGFEYDIYTDQLSGGYSVVKVFMDYDNEKSFNQKLFLKRCDPTMCIFDVLARLSHKGDGRFCGEIFPMTIDEFKNIYEHIDIDHLAYTSIGDFSWAYKQGQDKIILVCDYYEKRKKRKKLVFLANNTAMLREDYEQMLRDWHANMRIDQPPIAIRERTTEITEIWRHVFIQDQIIESEKTIYTQLPLIFVDGNSFFLRENGEDSDVRQFTRSYFYHAKDAQNLKNIAGQSLANELENMVQYKYIAVKEAIPEQYQEIWKNPQKPGTLVANGFLEDGITPIPLP